MRRVKAIENVGVLSAILRVEIKNHRNIDIIDTTSGIIPFIVDVFTMVGEIKKDRRLGRGGKHSNHNIENRIGKGDRVVVVGNDLSRFLVKPSARRINISVKFHSWRDIASIFGESVLVEGVRAKEMAHDEFVRVMGSESVENVG